MGQGSYVICEWDSVQLDNKPYQLALQRTEQAAVNMCLRDWAPRGFDVRSALSPKEGNFGRTTILPALFDDHNSNQMVVSTANSTDGTWRQFFTAASVTTANLTLIQGSGVAATIPEDFKVAWVGLAFPNKQQHVTEIKWQIGDRKYGRINLEEMKAYNKPAIIFEDGFILNEEESFHLYGTIEGPIPSDHAFITGLYQRIVMLGCCYFKVISKVLGDPGAVV